MFDLGALIVALLTVISIDVGWYLHKISGQLNEIKEVLSERS